MARINAPVLSCQPDVSKEQTQVSSGHLVGAGGIIITVQNVCRTYAECMRTNLRKMFYVC